MKIKQKIIFSFAMVILITTVFTALISSIILFQATEKEITGFLSETTIIAVSYAEKTIAASMNNVEEIATATIFSDKKSSIAEKEQYINQKVKKYGYRSGGIIGNDGLCKITGQNYSQEAFFTEAISGKAYFSRPYFNNDKTDMYLIIASPIIIDDKVSEVLYFITDTTVLSSLIDGISVGKLGNSYILDKNGYTLAYNDDVSIVFDEENAVLATKNSSSDKSLVELAKVEQKMINGETGIGTYKYYGQNCIQGYAPLKNTDGWSLAVTIDSDEYKRGAKTGISVISTVNLLFIAFAIIIGYKIGNDIGNPIKKCTERINQLSNGDLTSPVPDIHSNDETGILSKNTAIIVDTMNNIISDIQYYLNEISKGNLVLYESDKEYPGDFSLIKESIKSIVDSLNNVFAKVTNVSEQVLASAQSVTSASLSLSTGATEQASSIEELSATTAEIYTNSKQNAESASEASNESNEANKHIEYSNTQMLKVKNAMNDISVTSEEISKIIKSIDDIAFQTNILALNAAVEAARAGSAGKGFAVVADEVRNLSQKSAQAAKDTTKLINDSILAVQNGEHIVEETADYLIQLVEKISQVAEHITKISNASEEQSAATQQVNIGIDQIVAVVQANSSASEECAATSEELKNQAEALNELLSKFKLK